MKLEVCVDSFKSAINAVHFGADELEVCSSLGTGGMTPSLRFLKHVIDMVDLNVKLYPLDMPNEKPKVNVMIRCHDRWDFVYSEQDMEKMLADIETFKKLPVDRFVFGALLKNGAIDEVSCRKIIEKARPIPVTFHRAFDKCSDPYQAMKCIIKLGFDRLLTSGLQETVVNRDAIDLLKMLLEIFGKQIDIMPGAGIKFSNVHLLLNLGFKYIHGTFSKQVTLSSGEKMYVTEGLYVKKVKDIMKFNAEVMNDSTVMY